MLEQSPKIKTIEIRDADGNLVDQTLPLSLEAYAVIDRYCMFRSSIWARTEGERDSVFRRANELRHRHEKMRENDPAAATGNDLNNFWVLFEEIPRWEKEHLSPIEKWGSESRPGFSEKYLHEPLKLFAANIKDAYRQCVIDPESLKAQIQKAAAKGLDDPQACKQLSMVYIKLRSLGYSDRELTQ